MLWGGGGQIPNGTRWLPVPGCCLVSCSQPSPFQMRGRTGLHRRAFSNTARCSDPWIHAVCLPLHVQLHLCLHLLHSPPLLNMLTLKLSHKSNRKILSPHEAQNSASGSEVGESNRLNIPHLAQKPETAL